MHSSLPLDWPLETNRLVFSGFHADCLLRSSSPGQLRNLIAEAQSRGLRFVYALSPGQDIVFSSSCDLTLLKRKLRQVSPMSVSRRLSSCSFFSHHSAQWGSMSPSRCQTWAARPSPFCLMTLITPCVRLTARPSPPSLTLRLQSLTRSTGSWVNHLSSFSALQVGFLSWQDLSRM